MLRHTLAYNGAVATQATVRIARALGVPGAPAGLFDLVQRYGLPTSLAELGMPREGIVIAASAALQSPYPNPRPLKEDGIRQLLEHAYDGVRPE